MTEQLGKIAKRLKNHRQENDMPIEWAAKALGVTVDELRSYETGEEDIPVSFLYMAAKKYGVELSTLLTGAQPIEKPYSVVRKDEGLEVERNIAYGYKSLCTDFAKKQMEPLLVTVAASDQDSGLVYNSHPGQEFHYLLEGCIKYYIKDESITVEAGDSFMFHSEYPHAMKALDKKDAKILVVII